MPDFIPFRLNGENLLAAPGTTVASTILSSGRTLFRRSVSQEPRAGLCGMGICFECRVTIDGVPHSRSCQILCRDGMEVRTDD